MRVRGFDGGVTDYATYPSGLRLAGRRVVVVGGGHVAQRRVPALLAVGAEVTVVSPVVTPAIEGLADEISSSSAATGPATSTVPGT